MRAAESIQGTEGFLVGIGSPASRSISSRRALSSIYEIMAEVVKEEKRDYLRRAVAISITIDDRDAFRVCRFRCTLGDAGALSPLPVGASAPLPAGTKKLTRDGLLFIVRRGGEPSSASMEAYEKDYSKRMSASTFLVIRASCTPLGDVCDEGLVEHSCDRISTDVSDGASAA